jgi:hypothetical protein
MALIKSPQGRATPIEIGKLPEIDFDHDFDFDTELPRAENKNALQSLGIGRDDSFPKLNKPDQWTKKGRGKCPGLFMRW